MNRSPAARLVAETVAATFGTVSAEEIFQRNRSKSVFAARAVAMWILHHHYDMSLSEVGRQFDGYRWRNGQWVPSPSGKDHVTTRLAIKRVDDNPETLDLAKRIAATLPAPRRAQAPFPLTYEEASGAE